MPAPADNPSLRCVIWHPPGVPLPADLLNSLSRRIRRLTLCADAYSAMAEICAGGHDRREGRARAPESPPLPAPGGAVLVLVEPDLLPDLPDLLTEIRTFAPTAACWKFQQRANPRLSAVVESDVTTWMARGATAGAGVERSLNAARTTSNQQRDLSSTSSPLTPASTPRRAPTSTPPALRLTGQTGAPGSPMPLPTREPALRPTPQVIVRPTPPIRAKPSLILHAGPPPERPTGTPQTHPTAKGPAEPPSPPGPMRPTLTAEELRMLLGEDPIDAAGPRPTNGRHPPGAKPDDGKGGAR